MIHNLYLGLKPDAAERAAMLAERDRQRALHGMTGPDAKEENLHLTLYGLAMLETAPAWLLEGVKAALDAVEMPPFVIDFDRVMTFGRGRGRRAFVLAGGKGTEGVDFLRRELDVLIPRHLPRLRRPPELKKPHVTLLYDQRIVPETFIEPIRMQARELVLIDSLYGRGQHRAIGGRKLG